MTALHTGLFFLFVFFIKFPGLAQENQIPVETIVSILYLYVN